MASWAENLAAEMSDAWNDPRDTDHVEDLFLRAIRKTVEECERALRRAGACIDDGRSLRALLTDDAAPGAGEDRK